MLILFCFCFCFVCVYRWERVKEIVSNRQWTPGESQKLPWALCSQVKKSVRLIQILCFQINNTKLTNSLLPSTPDNRKLGILSFNLFWKTKYWLIVFYIYINFSNPFPYEDAFRPILTHLQQTYFENILTKWQILFSYYNFIYWDCPYLCCFVFKVVCCRKLKWMKPQTSNISWYFWKDDENKNKWK